MEEEDYSAMAEYFRQEQAHSERMVARLDNTLDVLGGNSGEWKPGQTMGERLAELDHEIGEDLQGGGGMA